MHSLSIKLYPDPVLRCPCQPVTEFDCALSDLVDEMFELMKQNNGIGLAAPQIGISKRIFISSINDRAVILINPVYQYCSPKEERQLEGCLSVPNFEVKIPRNLYVHLTGYDLHGHKIEVKAVCLEARVFQHEIDHLNGVLIRDYQRVLYI